MTDEEVEAALAEKLEHHEAQAERYRKMLALHREEGPVVAPPGKPRAAKPGKGTKPAKPTPAKEGEQRPRKGKSGGPRTTAQAVERKAKALQLLKDGKTPKEVAKELGVSEASIYLYRKNAKS